MALTSSLTHAAGAADGTTLSALHSAAALAAAPAAPAHPAADRVITFDAMGLCDAVLRGVYAHGFERPSPIQAAAAPAMLARPTRDVIAQAQSGTGKTGAFLIPVLQRVAEAVGLATSAGTSAAGSGPPGSTAAAAGAAVPPADAHASVTGRASVPPPAAVKTLALVLAPTRELAAQTGSVAASLATYLPGVAVRVCVGGSRVAEDAAALRAGAAIVVATPARTLDLLERGILRLADLRTLVVDEADVMLEEGHGEALRSILECGSLPVDVQLALFSATLTSETMALARELLVDPTTILLPDDELTLEGIRQYYVPVADERDKMDTLCDLYERASISQAIIYCGTRRQAEYVSRTMTERDFTVSTMHGELEAAERTAIMAAFRSGTTRVLVSTDLTARGIDVQAVSLVFNMSLPAKRENYLHRIGRSGRYGRKGVAITLLAPAEAAYMRDIERHYSTHVEALPADVEAATKV